ncbi:hypothetical protein, partial [Ottowia sp.]|uniref:hypothetical protein n=1 Tax=Ottowia sp. TaxID=1898956 RepID=UPI0026040D4E
MVDLMALSEEWRDQNIPHRPAYPAGFAGYITLGVTVAPLYTRTMTARLISKIHVEKLFGLYTYDIPGEGDLSNAAILYGDNGVGKSTLLRLAFHLLSAADDRGHRTALYITEFERIDVTLTSGVTLTARVIETEPTKLLLLEVLAAGKRLAIWDYRPRGERRFLDDEGFVFTIDADGQRVFKRKAGVDPLPRTGTGLILKPFR